jgi:TatD family-associated radical SAM protein
MMTLRGASYWLRNKLYLSLTNECNSLSPIALRGPSFKLPETSGFQLLDNEPTANDIFDIVDSSFELGKISVGSMESDEITFAGCGEPLLRLETLIESAKLIKDKRHGVPLRVKTNGLIHSSKCNIVASALYEAGIDQISICLISDNPTQYAKIMQPIDGTFSDVCSFTIACVEAGIITNCSAIERPDVNITGVRELAKALGASTFTSASYHP